MFIYSNFSYVWIGFELINSFLTNSFVSTDLECIIPAVWLWCEVKKEWRNDKE